VQTSWVTDVRLTNGKKKGETCIWNSRLGKQDGVATKSLCFHGRAQTQSSLQRTGAYGRKLSQTGVQGERKSITQTNETAVDGNQ